MYTKIYLVQNGPDIYIWAGWLTKRQGSLSQQHYYVDITC